jgi:hypothetical protein
MLRMLRFAVITLLIAISGATLWLAPRAYERDLSAAYAHRESGWAGSATCESCHPDHHASWRRTFHRTMTQEATAKSVLGAFDGRELTFWGVTARPVRRGEAFYFEYLDPDTGRPSKSLRIDRTVGSRRYQQYLTLDPSGHSGNYFRLPLLWHVAERRWIHLNGAFLGSDDAPYDQHVAVWNQNCIFCHNTGPRPGSQNFDELIERSRQGLPVKPGFDGRFQSEVAELGISCESCHAPLAEHARRNRDPLRRYLLHLSGREDPTVVNPARLDKHKSAAVCGQCHGQRLPRVRMDIRNWLIDGPSYRAGEDLAAHVEPVFQDTVPPGDPGSDLFRQRFWGDGTPRLTAYEYQGLLQSPCFVQGEMTCLSCHSMHEGDVFGQLRPEMRTNDACASCHAPLVRDVAAHTRHKPESSGSLCYDCHMPKAVYGILEIHRSHRIQSPDPARDAAAARPEACTSCHLDRTLSWAAEQSRRWWGDRYDQPPARADGAPLEVPDSVAAMLAGDPVQRAVAARLAGRAGTPLTPAQRAFLVPVLLMAMEDDYPAIRWFARLSLMQLGAELSVEAPGTKGLVDAARAFDYIAPRPARDAALGQMLGLWKAVPKTGFAPPPPGAPVGGDFLPLGPEAMRLIRLQESKTIHIGE